MKHLKFRFSFQMFIRGWSKGWFNWNLTGMIMVMLFSAWLMLCFNPPLSRYLVLDKSISCLLIHFFQQMFHIMFNDPWIHGKLVCLGATVNDHTMILVFLSCKKFTVTKIGDTYKSHLVWHLAQSICTEHWHWANLGTLLHCWWQNPLQP